MQLWKSNWKAGEELYKNVKAISQVGEDSIRIESLLEGVYDENDKENKGQYIPRYLAVLDEYDPDVKFLSTLPSIPIRNITPERTATEKKGQDTLYRLYFRFDSILENLKLNELVTKNQADQVRIHYNYLSSFVHPSKRSIKPMFGETYLHDFDSNYCNWLVLLYVNRILVGLFRNLLLRFTKENPNARVSKLNEIMHTIDIETKYFWFIDTDPSKEDIERSERMKQRLGVQADEDRTIVYFPDPLQRLESRGISVLSRSKSPKKYGRSNSSN